MINFVIGISFVSLLTIFWTGLFGTVTQLPWGMQEPFQTFMNNINIIRNAMPWMDELWKFIVYVLLFEIAFFIFNKTWDVVKLLRG